MSSKKQFKNRVREINELNHIASLKSSQMIVIYGRRRIGKTSLLRYWSESHRASSFYWTSYRTTSEQLLEGFSKRLAGISPGMSEDALFPTWESALTHLFNLAEKKVVIAIVDEFPYLVEMEPSIPSLIQKLWDEYADHSRLMLTLCGSHYHMMHEEFASSRRPLYGRATRHMILEEIAPQDLNLFLPRYSPEQIVETYGITGGIPAYLELWDDKRPVFYNVRELFLRTATFFSQEAVLLIQDEIAEPRTYLGILQAIGAGFKTPKQISDISGVAINHIGKYLSALVNLRFVRRVLSEDSENRNTSRNSKYEIRDPYLRFHFEYLYPYPDRRQFDGKGWIESLVKKNFASYIGKSSYEELSRQYLNQLGLTNKLSFVPQYVGRAWNRHAEIDVVAINWIDKRVIYGECKWTRKKMNVSDLDSLRERSSKLNKLKGFTASYVLFSRSGFTQALLKSLPEDTQLFSGGAFTEVSAQ